MKLGQKISGIVDSRPELYGAVYVLASRDDNEPVVLAAAPKDRGDVGPEVRFYLHGDPIKSWSWTTPEGDLGRNPRYPQLSEVKGSDPKNVRRTYDYLITVIGYDMLPVRFLMHGQWGGQAAKQLNTQLLLNKQRGIEQSTVAYKLQVKKTASPKGGQDRPFAQALVGLAKISAKDKSADQELVQAHIALVGSSANVSTLDDDDTVKADMQPVDTPSLD
jgi:hypothetical protein